MTTTLDTNVLVYASDESSSFHERAMRLLETLAAGPDLVYLFWPVALGYLMCAPAGRWTDSGIPIER